MWILPSFKDFPIIWLNFWPFLLSGHKIIIYVAHNFEILFFFSTSHCCDALILFFSRMIFTLFFPTEKIINTWPEMLPFCYCDLNWFDTMTNYFLRHSLVQFSSNVSLKDCAPHTQLVVTREQSDFYLIEREKNAKSASTSQNYSLAYIFMDELSSFNWFNREIETEKNDVIFAKLVF